MKIAFRLVNQLNRAYACTNIIRNQVYAYSTSRPGTVELSYSSFQKGKGNNDNLPLVLMHGLFGSKKNFESLAKSFSINTNRQVITVDVRNHGSSPHVAEMDYHSMCDDVERLLGKLCIAKAIVLGHSMGGKIAMVMALTKPELVSKLIVEDVSPTTSPLHNTSFYPDLFVAMRNTRFNQSASGLVDVRKEVGEQLKDVVPDVGVRNFILTNIERNADYHWRVNIDAIEANLDTLTQFPHIDTHYSGPTLFIAGSRSKHVTKENYPEIKRLFPAVDITHIEDAGHWVHSEKPYIFMDRVVDFINDS